MPAATPPPPARTPPVWVRPQRSARGPRPEFSRDRIAETAVALADAGGLGAATMRAVAAELGTAAASLYRYLASRDDLVDLMVDAVLADPVLTRRRARRPSADWLDDLVALGRDLLALHRAHPWLLEANARTVAFGPHGSDHVEHCLELMEPTGCGTAAKLEAVALITGIVSLFARPAPAGARTLAPQDVFAGASAGRHPRLTAALTHPEPPGPRPDLFEHTLRSVLLGLLRA
ncbi:TetR/AcrR family transcriptional regulator [Kineococcus rubinsiae]|uniref:TetR/AcrR family transcriptional regulator n=1 Tax=Kineococcus rubinsiae TaxID=2609562 RepID=UPI0014314F72|nr:TetR/AcrR family transcriptional regulator [Kineococcus rubinsiae]NIZ90866.1 TetR/AcrR family transcriptional regulator [Kineococcus rubinsiae]